MCGIVGMISKFHGFGMDYEDVFEEMLYLDGPRGMDSTGAFVVTKNNEVQIVKQAANPGIFLKTDSWKNLKSRIRADARIVVGHNRKASIGSIISKNAHPFAKEHIILVHNGYIANHKTIDATVEVDSEAIVTVLLKEDNPLEGLKQLFGAYAIVWYNKKTKTLYMARNKDRPLAIAHSENQVLFASEKGMLNWIMDRNNLFNFKMAQELKEDVLYEITLKPFLMKEHNIPGYTAPKSPEVASWGPTPTVREVMKESVDPTVFRDYPETFNQEEITEEEVLERMAAANTHGDDPLKDLQGELAQGAGASEEALEHSVQLLRTLYPFGSYALFMPRNVVQDGPKGHRFVRVRGAMWVPGKIPCEAVVIINSANDPEHYINPTTPLIAKIQSMSRRNQDIYFNLESIRPANTIVTTVNGEHLSIEEWTMICNRLSCDTCAHAIGDKEAKETEIIRTGPSKYDITCKTCFTNVYYGKKPNAIEDKPQVNP